MAHTIVKPEKLAATAVGLLENEIVVPQMMFKTGIDDFKGAENDSLSIKVPGVLPFHDYAWRNDRSAPIQMDEYAERKITVSFGGNVYSAVGLTDEQKDFDLDGWGTLLEPQARAVARGLENRAVGVLEGAPYNVTIAVADAAGPSGSVSKAIVEARRVLNRFKVPAGETRWLLVGSDFDAKLQNDAEFNKASNVGDSLAESALREALIGRWKGFTIVTSDEIDPASAYAFTSSAFVFLSGAPSVPDSVPFGATTSYHDIALRWVRDYDSLYMRDRSVVNTYAGFREVTDPLRYIPAGSDNEVISTYEHFVRGVKLTLTGTSDYPADTAGADPAQDELVDITGVTAYAG